MYGAICGDIIGSYYCTHDTHFNTDDKITVPRGAQFADNTVMLAAMCEVLLEDSNVLSNSFYPKSRLLQYAEKLKSSYIKYPSVGFDEMFAVWAKKVEMSKQSSYSVCSACRVFPIVYAYGDLEEVLHQTKCSCMYSHNHEEAITAAQAVASAGFLSMCGLDKLEIKQYIERKFGYNLSIPLESLKKNMIFDSRAVYSTPPALTCFLESDDFESAIRNALYLGGDTSATACIAGGLSEIFYKDIPEDIVSRSITLLDDNIKGTILKFAEKFIYTNENE